MGGSGAGEVKPGALGFFDLDHFAVVDGDLDDTVSEGSDLFGDDLEPSGVGFGAGRGGIPAGLLIHNVDPMGRVKGV
jgi:hypothetical protein